MDKITEGAIVLANEAFVKDWNNGDIEAACEVYAEDAVFATSSGVAKGRQTAIDKYREVYPNPATMGTLSLRVTDFRSPPEALGQMASALFEWELRSSDGEVMATGYALETYQLVDGKVRIMQDMSVMSITSL